MAETADELASNLATYEAQLEEVEALLLQEPNEELQDLYDNLTEVRALGRAASPVPNVAAAAAPLPPAFPSHRAPCLKRAPCLCCRSSS